MIKIDGSMLEGGGAIVRNAMALSTILKQPIEIFNIRAKRSNPGLAPQHKFAIDAIRQICNGKTEGVDVGSKTIRFYPGDIVGGEYKIDVQTAGSLTLIIQTITPLAISLQEPIKLFLKGGTDVPWSPPIDFIRYVYLPMLKKIGLEAAMCLGRRGHYPQGGGNLTFEIHPLLRAKPIEFHYKGELIPEKMHGRIHVVQLPISILERIYSTIIKKIEQLSYELGNIEKEYFEPKYDPHIGSGVGVTLWASNNMGTILSGSALGEKSISSEDVAITAVNNLVEQLKIGHPIDYHLADQLIIWMGLSPLPSVIDTSKISLHTLTNIELVRLFTGAKFTINGKENYPGIINCEPTPRKMKNVL